MKRNNYLKQIPQLSSLRDEKLLRSLIACQLMREILLYLQVCSESSAYVFRTVTEWLLYIAILNSQTKSELRKMEKERKNNLRRQMNEHHKWVAPPRTLVSLTESTDNISSKTSPVYSDDLYSQSVVKSKKRLLDPLTSPDTIALGRIKTIDSLASNIACRSHFYGHGEPYNFFDNEQQLFCAICHSKVLKKFLEFHAWMHLSWVFQVGDRFPFQCTRCEFAAYRIPDVVCHTKEIHDMRRTASSMRDEQLYKNNGFISRSITDRNL
ncbi:30S ribosomal protein [Dirofilaria immitis]